MTRTVGVKAKVERAAIELFASKGFDGVSIADIAAAAGVSQGALYRHYRSKDELASRLFSTAYRRTGAELDRIRAEQHGFTARIGAMVAHFCALYDQDAPLFRFMLISQHDLLPRLGNGGRAPVVVIEDTIADAIEAGEIDPTDKSEGTAVIMGVVLQTAIFHLYGRITGALLPRAPSLARAAIAAVLALR